MRISLTETFGKRPHRPEHPKPTGQQLIFQSSKHRWLLQAAGRCTAKIPFQGCTLRLRSDCEVRVSLLVQWSRRRRGTVFTGYFVLTNSAPTTSFLGRPNSEKDSVKQANK